jgi:hypothetical protein
MTETDDIFRGYGLEVALNSDDAFSIIRETLTRIGIPSYTNKTLTQSCHIFHKRGRYAIMHFKEMLAYDGKTNNIPEEDLLRRDTITKLLVDWNLITVSDKASILKTDMTNVKVLSAEEKKNWKLQVKYSIGRK